MQVIQTYPNSKQIDKKETTKESMVIEWEMHKTNKPTLYLSICRLKKR